MTALDQPLAPSPRPRAGAEQAVRGRSAPAALLRSLPARRWLRLTREMGAGRPCRPRKCAPIILKAFRQGLSGCINSKLPEVARMCGRYLLRSSPRPFAPLVRYPQEPNFLSPHRYNVAPRQPVPSLRMGGASDSLLLVRLGLDPSWLKDPRTSLARHARIESVNDNPASSCEDGRASSPRDGFYEGMTLLRQSPFCVRPRMASDRLRRPVWRPG